MLKMMAALAALVVGSSGVAHGAESRGGTAAADTGSRLERITLARRLPRSARHSDGTGFDGRTILSAAPDERAFTRRLLHPEITARSLESLMGTDFERPLGGGRAVKIDARDASADATRY